MLEEMQLNEVVVAGGDVADDENKRSYSWWWKALAAGGVVLVGTSLVVSYLALTGVFAGRKKPDEIDQTNTAADANTESVDQGSNSDLTTPTIFLPQAGKTVPGMIMNGTFPSGNAGNSIACDVVDGNAICAITAPYDSPPGTSPNAGNGPGAVHFVNLTAVQGNVSLKPTSGVVSTAYNSKIGGHLATVAMQEGSSNTTVTAIGDPLASTVYLIDLRRKECRNVDVANAGDCVTKITGLDGGGASVAFADFDGDGELDLIVGGENDAGVNVLFWQDDILSNREINLKSPPANVKILSVIAPDPIGYSLSDGGRFVGKPTVVMGTAAAKSPDLQVGYLVPGGAEMKGKGTLDLSQEGNAIKFQGAGLAVSGGVDVNGDGYPEMLFGNYKFQNATGNAYLVFGNKDLLQANSTIDLANPPKGVDVVTFASEIADTDSYLGYALNVGYVNSQAVVIISAAKATANDLPAVGETYVIPAAQLQGGDRVVLGEQITINGAVLTTGAVLQGGSNGNEYSGCAIGVLPGVSNNFILVGAKGKGGSSGLLNQGGVYAVEYPNKDVSSGSTSSKGSLGISSVSVPSGSGTSSQVSPSSWSIFSWVSSMWSSDENSETVDSKSNPPSEESSQDSSVQNNDTSLLGSSSITPVSGSAVSKVPSDSNVESSVTKSDVSGFNTTSTSQSSGYFSGSWYSIFSSFWSGSQSQSVEVDSKSKIQSGSGSTQDSSGQKNDTSSQNSIEQSNVTSLPGSSLVKPSDSAVLKGSSSSNGESPNFWRSTWGYVTEAAFGVVGLAVVGTVGFFGVKKIKERYSGYEKLTTEESPYRDSVL